MTELSYGPGNWLGVVRANTVIVLDERTGNRLIAELWDFLAGRPQVDEVLNRVTSGFGTELTGMPAFGIITFGERPRAILRGEMTLTASAGNTRLEVSGREVTTWSERSLPDAEVFELRLADDGAEPVLPLSEGVVRLSRLLVGTAPQIDQPEPDLSHTLVSSEFTESAPAPDWPAVEPEPAAEPDAEPAVLNPAVPEPVSEPVAESAGEPPSSPAASEPLESTSSYDHLWDRTIARSVEDAAIRVPGEAEDVEPPAPARNADPEGAGQPAGTGAAAIAEAAAPVPAAPLPAVPFPAAPPAGSGLIESVPWLSPASPAEPETVGEPEPGDPDHDGHTVLRSDLAPAALPERAPEPGAGPSATGPMVLARLCPAGHANPPTSARCSVCGQAVAGDARQVRRPVLGRMRISSGEVVDLDRSLVVGRQPSVSRVHGDGMPKLVQVGSRAGDISRSHVEVRLEGWDVILVDLKATNGTVLVREGQLPRRLGQGEQAMLLDGDIAELGEDVSLRFEGLR